MKKILSMIALSQLLIGAAYADSDIVVIVNPAAANLTKEQVSDLFLGKIKIYKPLDLPNSAALKAEFYQKVSGHDLSQVKATWSRLLFTGQAQPPKELPDAAAVKKAVAADPKAVGYISKADVDASVKVILELQ
jgi:ABC-type phosphate transport system substrate-binding protein